MGSFNFIYEGEKCKFYVGISEVHLPRPQKNKIIYKNDRRRLRYYLLRL
jgi:hypothetical protein